MENEKKPLTQQQQFDLLKKVFWTAFDASRPVGVGFLHTDIAAALTRENVITPDHVQKDADGNMQIYADYWAGRMMKTSFCVTKDGTIGVSPEQPRNDYQSWGAVYKSATDLIADALRV